MPDLATLDDVALARFVADEGQLIDWLKTSIAALPGAAHPEVMTGLRGTLGIELSRADGPDTTLLATFGGDTVEFVDQGSPDVTVTTTAVRFAHVLTGRARAALLYLADELVLKGDELMGLALDAVVTSANSGGVKVDPTLLDPVEVSRAIQDVSTAHLHDVMGGALREVVLGEVFRRLPDFLIERKARGADLAVAFRVEGASGAPADRFLVEVSNGACTVTRDPDEAARRDVTLLLDGPGFLRLVLGHTNPVRAVMSGRLHLKGDPGKALAFNSMMRIPKP